MGFLAQEQEDLGEIGEDLGLAPPQEISAFKEEENDFASNGMQDFIPTQSADPMGFGTEEGQSDIPVAKYSGLEEFEASPAYDGGNFMSQVVVHCPDRVWCLLKDDFQDSDELGSGMSNMNIAR